MSIRTILLLGLGLSLCSAGCEKKKAAEKSATPTAPIAPATPVTPKVEAPKTPPVVVPVGAASGSGSGAGSGSAQAAISPDEAMRMLKEGNARFMKGEHKPFAMAEDRKRLVKGQHPHTMILSCADSRVPPEIVFDERLGDLFVVRVAGEALDSKVVASLEYAAANLGAGQLVVMGHENCGAVAASLKTKAGTSAGSADLDKLVEFLRPRADLGGKSSGGFVEEAKSKTRFIVADLMKRSTIIRDSVGKGKLRVSPAIYHLESGEVEFFQ